MPLRVTKTDADDRELGLRAVRERSWQQAITHLGNALVSDPDDVEAMNGLALAHNALGDGKTARSILARAKDIAPDFAETYRNLARLLADEGRSLEAADSACRAVELDPANREAVELLEGIRTQLRAVKPVGKKKGKKRRQTTGPTQADIDSRLSHISSALRKSAALVQADSRSSASGPTISLCMIARNEEQFLGDSLKSVEGIVDEIVVVDTGSTDRTPEIAKSHGAVVHRFDWSDNYSDARNVSLEHAKGDWILVLDADERLDESSRNEILKAVRNPSADAYALTFRNYLAADSDARLFVHRACRLYRNRPEYRYTGRVHERVDVQILNSGGRLANLDALIHHYGYRPEMMDERRKHERYINLLQADLKDNPDDPYCLYNLGMIYSSNGEYENAVTYFNRAAELVVPRHEFAAATFSRLAQALCKTGRVQQALTALDLAEQKGIRHPELHYCRGNALLILGRYEEAIPEFQSAMREGQGGIWLGDPGVFGHKAEYGIARAFAGLGDYGRAIEHCRKVILANPDDAQAHELLGAAYFNMGDSSSAEKHLQRSLQLGASSQAAVMHLAETYQAQGRYQEARARYQELLESGSETPELRFKLGICMQALGELEPAEKNYLRAIELREDCPQAHAGLGLLYSQQDRVAEALDRFARAVEIDPAFSDAHFGAGDLLYSKGRYAEAADVYQAGLSRNPQNAQGFLGLGNCYFRMSAYEAAVMAYRQALAIRPGYREAESNLSLAQQAVIQQKAA